MAKLISLNYKRNVNYFTDGNPETRWPHVLNTVGRGKKELQHSVLLEDGTSILLTEDDKQLDVN